MNRIGQVAAKGTAWAFALVGAFFVMAWYSSPMTSFLLADAWLLCTGAR